MERINNYINGRKGREGREKGTEIRKEVISIDGLEVMEKLGERSKGDAERDQ